MDTGPFGTHKTLFPQIRDPQFAPASTPTIKRHDTGRETFDALKKQAEFLQKLARESGQHEVILMAHGVNADRIRYVEPHAILIEGKDEETGHPCSVVIHFSQLNVKLLFAPTATPQKKFIGFDVQPMMSETAPASEPAAVSTSHEGDAAG